MHAYFMNKELLYVYDKTTLGICDNGQLIKHPNKFTRNR